MVYEFALCSENQQHTGFCGISATLNVCLHIQRFFFTITQQQVVYVGEEAMMKAVLNFIRALLQ